MASTDSDKEELIGDDVTENACLHPGYGSIRDSAGDGNSEITFSTSYDFQQSGRGRYCMAFLSLRLNMTNIAGRNFKNHCPKL